MTRAEVKRRRKRFREARKRVDGIDDRTPPEAARRIHKEMLLAVDDMLAALNSRTGRAMMKVSVEKVEALGTETMQALDALRDPYGEG